MSWMQIGWAIALIAAMWFVPVAAIRVMAYRSGVDQTPGMRAVAVVASALAVTTVLALILFTLLIAA